jgi:CHC2 zinc finger
MAIPVVNDFSTEPTDRLRPAPEASGFSRSATGRAPMAELLAALGVRVNTRTHRAPCPVHRGENPTSFSWREDGRWHCFNCNAGGDQIALVRAVRACSFREALAFLAELGGVPVEDARPARTEIENRRKTQKLASTLEVTERALLVGYREEIHLLEKIRAFAGARISAVEAGEQERFPNEVEAGWCALVYVARDLPAVTAAYCLLAFGAPAARAEFVLHPSGRAAMIERTLSDGWIADDRGRRVELLL